MDFSQYNRSDLLTLNKIQQQQRQLYLLPFSPLPFFSVTGSALPLRFGYWQISPYVIDSNQYNRFDLITVKQIQQKQR